MLTANKYKLTLTNNMVDGAVIGCLGEKDDSFREHRYVCHSRAGPYPLQKVGSRILIQMDL
jgi:hypothetical protein